MPKIVPEIKNTPLKIIFCLVIITLTFPISYGESELYNKDADRYPKLPFETSDTNNLLIFGQNMSISDRKGGGSNMQKAVIIMFDRGYETQFTSAKPILDKYGFKASFFIICSFVDGNGYYEVTNGTSILNKNDTSMSWKQIIQLQKEGHDIESHGREHRYLKNLSSQDLEYEIAGSKECLRDHGLKSSFFQFPNNKGADDSAVLKMVSKYFDFGLSGHSRLMFLNCDGWQNHGFKMQIYKYQSDCRTYWDDGTPTRTNKFSIKEWSHDRFHSKLNNKYLNLVPHGEGISNMLLSEFVNVVEGQKQYNEKAGKIVAIPIVGYHMISTFNTFDTPIELFDKEMNYLYSNGFEVLKLSDLGYNKEANHFYIK